MNQSLHDLMTDSTAHITPSPGFRDAVVHGAKRRRQRRRATTAGTLTALVALGGTLTVGGALPGQLNFAADTPTPHSSPLSGTQGGPLSDGRVHGDLAQDDTYLTEVRQAWRTWMASTGQRYQHPDGDPRILWAGRTPAGPAAVLAQTVRLPDRVGATQAATYATIGFVGDRNGAPSIVAANFDEDARDSLAWYVDEQHKNLVVSDNDVTRGITLGWQYADDGSRSQTYQPLTFTDGAAIVTIPQGVDRTGVAVSDLPFHNNRTAVRIANVELDDTSSHPRGRGLNWTVPPGTPDRILDLPFHGNGWTAEETGRQMIDMRDLLDQHTVGIPNFGFYGGYIVHGTTPNGTAVRLVEDQLDNEPAHLYLTYGNEFRHAGTVDPQATLPIAVRLPDGQGWVVAQLGATLRYRIGTGPWTGTRMDAALAPDGATSVEVTVPSGSREQVVLTNR